MNGTDSMLEAALALAACGMPVFPVYGPGTNGSRCACGKAECERPAKHPRTRNGLKAATTSVDRIRGWFESWPHANVGVRTGLESGLFVLDVDPAHGGGASLAALEEAHGGLPDTVESETGGGGRHLLFRHPGGKIPNRIGVLPGLDVRGDGGYIVAPPSVHATGGIYAWRRDRGFAGFAIASPPLWLLGIILGENPSSASKKASAGRGGASPRNDTDSRTHLLQRARAYVAKVAGVTEGRRNAAAFALAGHLAAFVGRDRIARLVELEILALVESWNMRNAPPLGGEELRETVHNGLRNGNPRSDKTPSEERRPAGQRGAPGGSGSSVVPLSDIGNAERLVREHGEDLRYVPAWGWLGWDGSTWRRDDARRIELLAKETVRRILDEAKDTSLPADIRTEIAKHAIRSENDSRIRAMLSRACPELPARPEDFDADPFLLNVENGTLDLRTGRLHPHRREDFISRIAPVEFDPKARSVELEKFLHYVTGGDAEFCEYLLRAVGYSITGDTREDLLFLLLGPGNSGKTTLLVALAAMLGDYVKSVPFEALLVREGRSGGGPRPELVHCVGARIVRAAEVDEGRRFSAATLKSLTGGDRMTLHGKFKDPFETDTTYKLWLAANHAPRLDARDSGARRRLVLLPFAHSVSKVDKGLRRRLQEPEVRRALLALAVRGCAAWKSQGLGSCAAVEQATARYWGEQSASDDIATFVEQCCVREEQRSVSSAALFAAFVEFAEDRGREPASSAGFGRKLRDMGFHPDRTGKGRFWRGLSLREPRE